MCMYAHVHLVSTNDIQKNNCGVSYPHAVCVKGVPHYREAGGSFFNSHLWKQEKWELAEKQPPPRGVLPCSAQWSWSQNQKKEIPITSFRRPHLPQWWPFWGADVWQWKGQNPVSVYSHHLIPIYLFVMISRRKRGLRDLFWTQITPYGFVKGRQVHWKEGSTQKNVREFPSLLLPLREDEESRQSRRAFYSPALLLTQAVYEDLGKASNIA